MLTTPLCEDTERYFIECCRTKLVKEYLPKIILAVEHLSDNDLWWRTYETNNSIGNLMLHLTGNITQWAFQHLGGNTFQRNRDAEFAERTHLPKDELIARLTRAVTDVDTVLAEFPTEKLRLLYHIQKYQVTGLEAILHITEHFSYHVGQIVYISKLRSGQDLKMYQF